VTPRRETRSSSNRRDDDHRLRVSARNATPRRPVKLARYNGTIELYMLQVEKESVRRRGGAAEALDPHGRVHAVVCDDV
jgi:hypothetical protein